MRFVEKYILTEKLIECIIVYNNTAIQIYMNGSGSAANIRGGTAMNHTMPNISLSNRTNLLDFDTYEYELQEVDRPELFREMFPYTEVPKVAYNYRHVPMNMPENII